MRASTSTPRRKRYRGWTAAEVRILRENYLSKGSEWVASTLNRSVLSVRSKAQSVDLDPAPPAQPSDRYPDAIALLLDYRGLPLSLADITDELSVSYDAARRLVSRMLGDDRVRSWYLDGQLLLAAKETDA